MEIGEKSRTSSSLHEALDLRAHRARRDVMRDIKNAASSTEAACSSASAASRAPDRRSGAPW